ncbi:MAG: hypothetical protein EKK48_25750 [Candidatus Melainabacteria bacterium]|nr:MAG: hypothetical protein EKK48_25750 [Candidatus Melainabacteria bacterium]
MKCSEALPLLDLLYDQLLETKDSALVIDHLQNCVNCQDEWESMEDLKRRFKAAKKNTTMPPELVEKISLTLRRDDISTLLRTSSRQFPLVGIAASILILGWIVVPQLTSPNGEQRTQITASHLSATKLINSLTTDGAVHREPNKQLLNEKLGYEPKYIPLPEWKMESSGVYTDAANIARFDFVRNDNPNQHLSCYQAIEGTIIASGSVQNIGGKQVVLGTESGYQFAKFTQNGRDYLFVTKLPTTTLEEIIRGA